MIWWNSGPARISNRQSIITDESPIKDREINNHDFASAVFVVWAYGCAPSNGPSHERTAIASLTTSFDRKPSKASDTGDHFWHGL
jgi:hypothetical protein